MLNKSNGTSNFKLLFLKKGQRLSPKFLPLLYNSSRFCTWENSSGYYWPSHSALVTLWFGILCETWIKIAQGRFWC